MGFVTRQVTEDFNGPWQVGYFATIDQPIFPPNVPVDPNITYPTRTINTWFMESQHGSRLAAASWCSFLNGGFPIEMQGRMIADAIHSERAAVGKIMTNIRG